MTVTVSDDTSTKTLIVRLARTAVTVLLVITLATLFAEFGGNGWSRAAPKFLTSGVFASLALGIAAVVVAAITTVAYLDRR